MIRKGSDRKIEVAEHKFGADGFITVRNLINGNEELNGKGRVFAHTTVLPGSSAASSSRRSARRAMSQ